MLDFSIEGYSIPKLEKEKNGDCYLYEIWEPKKLVLAIVADGVSQQPCDWLASKMTCENIITHFKSSKTTLLDFRMSESIDAANEQIVNTEGACEKMAATVSFLVWPYEEDTFYCCNVGDSRIYHITKEKITCLTKDDTSIRTESIRSYSGIQVVKQPLLTKVMGQDRLQVTVEKHGFMNGQMLLLATDGFYGARKATFEKKILALSHASDFKAMFQETVENFEIFREDDMSVIALKRN